MGEEKPFEPIRKIRPGDEVLRRRRRPRRRLRIAPNIPGSIRFLKVIVTQTPLVPMLSLVLVLWLLFSAGFYFADHGGSGSAIDHYGDALWWSLVAMTTMGTASIPVTGTGLIVGGIWAVVGVILFWGTIIASITSYFMRVRQRPTTQIISIVQYNLEQLEDLSLDELELLKETADGLIDAHIGRLKRRQSSGNDSKESRE